MKKIEIRQLFIVLTDRCNLKCKHCCFACSPSNNTFLPKEKVFEIIDNALRLNYDILDLSGGEPTTHPDFPEILAYAVKSPFRLIAIASNLFRVKDLESLFDSMSAEDKNRLVFRIGIDGPNAAIHDELRGKGAFEMTMRGMDFLRKKGIKLQSANSLLSVKNYDYLDQLVEFINKEGFINNNWIAIFPYGNGEQFSKNQLTTELWFGKLYDRCLEYSQKYSTVFTYCGPFVKADDHFKMFPLAKNNSNGLVVNERGNVYAGCIRNMYTEEPIANVFERSFEECHRLTDAYFEVRTDCENCESRFPCKGTFIYKNQSSIIKK